MARFVVLILICLYICSMEIWKDIKGYEGFYQISNYGQVKSMNRSVKYSNGKIVKYKSKLRNASCSEYRLISLSKNGNVKVFKISRLVAMHFLPKIKYKNIVNHKDGNKYNDHVSNLEWCNNSENVLHAVKNNLTKTKNKVSGVFFEERRNKWAAYLYRNNKNIFIGRYENYEDAVYNRNLVLNKINIENH